MPEPSGRGIDDAIGRSEDARLYAEAILDIMREPLLILNADFFVETANDAFYRTFQVEPAETEGRLVYELGNRQWEIPRLRELLEQLLPKRGEVENFEVEHEFELIGRRVMILKASCIDHMQLILLAIEDQTEARRVGSALAQSEAKFRALVESTAQAVWETDARGAVVSDSPSWRAFTGQALDEFLAGRWFELIHPEDRERVEKEWQESVTAERLFDTEFRLRNPEKGYRWARSRATPVRDGQGRIVSWIGMDTDITRRKEAEEQRELLLGELSHRVKNIFAVIRSLASQGQPEQTADAYRQAFLGRLDALFNAHALALESRSGSIELATLARRTLEPYAAADRSGNIEVKGDRIELNPRQAVSLSILLHELATNAAKYGALSTREGRLLVTWQVTDEQGGRRAWLLWQEHGGPPVTSPEESGFGTKLIARVFEHELHGELELEFREDGLRVEGSFPLS